jgi:hypothetical protein
MLRGADGAFYGLINVKNSCKNGSTACGHIPAGNCLWRAGDLKDPASFRARDQDGNFTVRWGSAYSNEPNSSSTAGDGSGGGACATIPVTTDGPFGEHVVFRKVVPSPPSAASTTTTKQPTFIALGDVVPFKGRVKYSLTYEPDFGAAMRRVDESWTAPQFLDLGENMQVLAAVSIVRVVLALAPQTIAVVVILVLVLVV